MVAKSKSTYPQANRRRRVKEILDQKTVVAEEPSEDPAIYRAFRTVNRTQMGFAAVHADGKVNAFLYHSLANVRLEPGAGAEFLSFTDSGKAVTIQGTGLMVILHAILRGCLMEIRVADGRPVEPDQPVIHQMAITDTAAKGKLPG